MKISQFLRKFRVLGIVLLVLLVTGVGSGYYLTRQYPKEWNSWKNLSGSEKRRVIGLETKRFWRNIFPPAPRAERYAPCNRRNTRIFNASRCRLDRRYARTSRAF